MPVFKNVRRLSKAKLLDTSYFTATGSGSYKVEGKNIVVCGPGNYGLQVVAVPHEFKL